MPSNPRPSLSPKALSLLQLNAAVLLWGGTAMFAKSFELPVNHIIGVRSLIAAIAIAAFLLVRRSSFRLKRRTDIWLFLALGVLLCAHWLLYFQALKLATAAVAVLALQSYLIMSALVEPLVFKEKFYLRDLGLAAIVFIGMLVMTPAYNLDNDVTRGILLGIVSAVLFTGRNLLTRKCVRDYSGPTLMFWQVLVTSLILIPTLFIGAAPQPQNYPPKTILLFLLLGVVFTAIPHSLYTQSFKHLSARTIGMIATMLPLYAGTMGYLVHDETLSMRTLVGGSIILACIIFETIHVSKRPDAVQNN